MNKLYVMILFIKCVYFDKYKCLFLFFFCILNSIFFLFSKLYNLYERNVDSIVYIIKKNEGKWFCVVLNNRY